MTQKPTLAVQMQPDRILSDFELYLFNEGCNYQSYKMLGAHPYTKEGVTGYFFAVWAPAAKAVSVVGDFNSWKISAHPMHAIGTTGVWEVFIPGIKEGECYKYAVADAADKLHYKSDPFGFFAQIRPDTASVTADLSSYCWRDQKWQQQKRKHIPYSSPMNTYEVHIGSWRRHADGTCLSYTELADQLVDYVLEMGYTHIELMPLAEHPFDGSWGYQVTGYFAATSRYGKPEDLMHLIDCCHQKGIGVILDWVPAHFPRDAHGLAKFDGTSVYEYGDPKIGEHKEWGTLVFDYSKKEVISFLISNACFWFDVYHVDGLRVDAVSSMLYRNYNRKPGEWVANVKGGNENLEAVAFLQKLNQVIFEAHPNALMVAEESTSWPKVTSPVHEGGLGFNFKWNMGWMNDMLCYMSMDPYFRKHNHNLLTFLMVYSFSENYILPLSHDEAVHGKRSLLNKMYGSYEEKFAQLRAFYAYTMAQPGKKLLFMGGEFGQFIEWAEGQQLDWLLLDYPAHAAMHQFVKDLNHFYLSAKAFWQIEDGWEGFRWVNEKDADHSVLSFLRMGKAKGDFLITVCNFTPMGRVNYPVGVPSSGTYQVVFHTDDVLYGGTTKSLGTIKAQKKEYLGYPYRIEVDLAPLSTLYLRKKKEKRKSINTD